MRYFVLQGQGDYTVKLGNRASKIYPEDMPSLRDVRKSTTRTPIVLDEEIGEDEKFGDRDSDSEGPSPEDPDEPEELPRFTLLKFPGK